MKPKLDIEKENNPLEQELFVGFSRDIYYFQDLLRFHYLVREEVCQEGVADKEAEIQRVGWATPPVLEGDAAAGCRSGAAAEALGGTGSTGVLDHSLVTLATGRWSRGAGACGEAEGACAAEGLGFRSPEVCHVSRACTRWR